jgi:amino acid transporter
MFSSSRDAFIANFNARSGTDYNTVIQTAQNAGYNTKFVTSALFLGSIYAFLNFYGFQWSTYVGGEVKEVGRSQIIAICGSVIVFTIFVSLSYLASYSTAGSEFVHAAAYLSDTGDPVWTAPIAPWSSYMVSFATDSPLLGALVGFSIIASVFGALTTVVIYGTRVIFAWSFDRIIPTAFSEVDERQAPRNALFLVFVVGVVYSILAFYTDALSFLSYEILGMWVATGLIGVGAAVFPYRRPEIFEKAPEMVQRRVGNVPLMTIFGTITALTGFFVAIAQIAPQFTDAPVNSTYLLFIIFTMLLALVIYFVAAWYNKRRGIDMDIGFREIPPA